MSGWEAISAREGGAAALILVESPDEVDGLEGGLSMRNPVEGVPSRACRGLCEFHQDVDEGRGSTRHPASRGLRTRYLSIFRDLAKGAGDQYRFPGETGELNNTSVNVGAEQFEEREVGERLELIYRMEPKLKVHLFSSLDSEKSAGGGLVKTLIFSSLGSWVFRSTGGSWGGQDRRGLQRYLAQLRMNT